MIKKCDYCKEEYSYKIKDLDKGLCYSCLNKLKSERKQDIKLFLKRRKLIDIEGFNIALKVALCIKSLNLPTLYTEKRRLNE